MDETDKTHIRELVHELIEEITPEIEKKNLHFRYLLQNISCPEFETDHDGLKRTLCELLKNAVRFTPDGGDVIMTASELMHGETDMTLEFVIQDNGIGMSAEKQEAVMNAQVPETDHAEDLSGLDYARFFAARHDGTILLESGENQGTVVRLILTFPVKESEAVVPIQKFSRDIYHFDGKKVLLVEDHPLNREIAQGMLEKAGVLVETAANGAEAVDKFREHGEDYDLVLMDIRMPVMDGISATREIRGLENTGMKIPIIALTASAYEGDSRKSRDAGMNEAILKPIDPGKMYRVLSKYLYPKTDAESLSQ